MVYNIPALNLSTDSVASQVEEDIFDIVARESVSALGTPKAQPWKTMGYEPAKEVYPASWNIPGQAAEKVVVEIKACYKFGSGNNGCT
jgi:hypothetical protein